MSATAPWDRIAAQVGTPAYVYDAATLDAAARRWIAAVGDPADVSYSVKACSNLAILDRLARHGIGFEVATPGELGRVRAAGIPASRVVFGGVPKTAEAVRTALDAAVDLLVLQARHEVEAAIGAAVPDGAARRLALRVRPGIRAGAHPSLETARADAKFGFAPAEVPEAWARLSGTAGLLPRGLAVHLGSGLDGAEPYERALEVLLELVDALAGSGDPVVELDLGGGLGVDYAGGRDPEPAELLARLRARLGGRPLRLRFEPGRSLTARAGTLLTRVLYRLERDGRPALVCDAGSTDFSRFALYRAEHRIEPAAGEPAGPPTVDVLGPTCESGDVLGTGRALQGVKAGDLLLVRDVGAYGFVMASNYNARPRPAEVLVEDGAWRAIRAREAIEDLWRGEVAEPGGMGRP